MPSTRWLLLDKVRSQLTQVKDFPREILPLLAARIEKAVCATSQESLREFADELSALLADLIRVAPRDALKAAHGEQDIDPSLTAAFVLGEVSFAQLLASQAANKRASNRFLTLFKDTTPRRYINALAESELRNIDLAKQLGISAEHISRTLKQLREEGITDFRRDGRDAYNFLTPAARAVLDSEHASSQENSSAPLERDSRDHQLRRSETQTIKHSKLQEALKKVDPSLQTQTTFADLNREKDFA